MPTRTGERAWWVCFWLFFVAATIVAVLLGIGSVHREPGIEMPKDFGYVALGAAFAGGLVFRAWGVLAVAIATAVFGIALVAGTDTSDSGEPGAGSLLFLVVCVLTLSLAVVAALGAALGTLVLRLLTASRERG